MAVFKNKELGLKVDRQQGMIYEPDMSGKKGGQTGQDGQGGPKRTTWLWKDANNMDAKEYEINSCMKGNFETATDFRNHKE